jgi:hypothetical protein
MANEKMDFAAEFPEDAEALNTEAPVESTDTAEEADASARELYTLKDGTEGSRAAYIREMFLQDNLSRKEIAEQTGFAYRVVYSATVNMTNSAEATSRGRSATASKVTVTLENKLVTERDGITYVDGEKVEDGTDLGELTEVDRNTWIKERVEEGISRGDIAKWLDMSYGVIYGITKDQDGTRARITVTLPDGTEVSRAEYIRMQFAAGVSRGDIAKELDVPYPVVWQATKTKKTETDRFEETVEMLKSFTDKVDNADLFGQVLSALATIKINEPEETVATAEAAAETPSAE